MKAIKITLLILLSLFILLSISLVVGVKQLAKKENLVKIIDDQTQAQVKIDDVKIKWFPLSINIKGLSLDPKDTSLKQINPNQSAISLAELSLYVDIKAAAQKKIKINHIKLKQATINATVLTNGEIDIAQWLSPKIQKKAITTAGKTANHSQTILAGVDTQMTKDITFVLDQFSLDQTTLNLKLQKENALINIENLAIGTQDFQYPLTNQKLAHSIDVDLNADISYTQLFKQKQKQGSAKAKLLLNGTTTMSYLVDQGEFFPNIITTQLNISETSQITLSDNLVQEINKIVGLAKKIAPKIPLIESVFNISKKMQLVARYDAPKESVTLLQPLTLEASDWKLTVGNPGEISIAKETQNIGINLIVKKDIANTQTKETLTKLGLDKTLLVDGKFTFSGDLKGSFSKPKLDVGDTLSPKKLLKETVKEKLKSEIGNQLKGLFGK